MFGWWKCAGGDKRIEGQFLFYKIGETLKFVCLSGRDFKGQSASDGQESVGTEVSSTGEKEVTVLCG